ncbi:efflux RND transporter periplasmic adaptor subunit [Betaproteobacteria bacterium]|nr:efflux RND transporter periplasmic adaptor subunit [Betaproteobacteria bacterium]
MLENVKNVNKISTAVVLFSAVVVIIILLLLIFGTSPTAKSKKLGLQSPGVLVETIRVELAEIREKINLTGEFKANDSVFLRAEVPGKITSINFYDGKLVKQGESLIKLDDAIPLAEFLQASAEYELAEKNYMRAEKLSKRDFVSTGALEDANAKLGVAYAKKLLTEARLKQYIIRSPFDGVVGFRNVSVGDFVQVGQKILLLEDLKRLKFDFKVPEKYINDIKEGNEIKIFTETKDRAITAKVDVLNVNVEKNGRFLLVRSFIDNSDLTLRSGMFGKVSVEFRKKNKGLTVPEVAIFSEQSRKFVWRIQDGKAEKVKIDTGIRVGETVEILNGLNVQDSVVTKGKLKLRKTGQQVTVQNKVLSEN